MPPAVPDRTCIDTIYGSDNVTAWADANNTEDDDVIEARLLWGLTDAYDDVIGRLNSRFSIMSMATLPRKVLSLIGSAAGIKLYGTPRGLVDGDSAFQMINSEALRIATTIDQLLAGQMELLDVAGPEAYPMTVNDNISGNNRKVAQALRFGADWEAANQAQAYNPDFYYR